MYSASNGAELTTPRRPSHVPRWSDHRHLRGTCRSARVDELFISLLIHNQQCMMFICMLSCASFRQELECSVTLPGRRTSALVDSPISLLGSNFNELAAGRCVASSRVGTEVPAKSPRSNNAHCQLSRASLKKFSPSFWLSHATYKGDFGNARCRPD